MVVENSTIIIAIALTFLLLVVYRIHKLTGSLGTIGFGVFTLYYSSLTTDPQAYGLLGWVILAGGLLMLVDYLIQPINKRTSNT